MLKSRYFVGINNKIHACLTLMVETFTVEENCHKFLCFLIPEYNQFNAPWNLMFFFSHFIWSSMGDLGVEHVTGSVMCQITYCLFCESYHWVTYRSTSVTKVRAFTSHQCGQVQIHAISGLSLLTVHSLALRGFSSLFRNQHFQIPIQPLLSDHIW